MSSTAANRGGVGEPEYPGVEMEAVVRVDAGSTEWMAWGRCRDEPPDLFFPTDGVGVRAAQEVCALCLVREQCLNYAVAHRIAHGVWGGASTRTRRRIARSRRVEPVGLGAAPGTGCSEGNNR